MANHGHAVVIRLRAAWMKDEKQLVSVEGRVIRAGEALDFHAVLL